MVPLGYSTYESMTHGFGERGTVTVVRAGCGCEDKDYPLYVIDCFSKDCDKNPIMEHFSLSFCVLFTFASLRLLILLPPAHTYAFPHPHTCAQSLLSSPGE